MKASLGATDRLKWILCVAGIALALGDVATVRWLGARFTMNGHDASVLVLFWFGVSFAVLGFLLGDSMAARHREERAADTIRRQMEELTKSRAQLEQSEKLVALGKLATTIAHEVRNPLAVIRSAAQNLAEMHPPREDARRSSAFITAEVDRLSNLVNSLLAFARPVRLAPRQVAVRDLFERVRILAAEELASRNVGLRIADAGSATVNADSDLMS